ncbi:MAG: preprotein translocase subunit TatA [Halodesulfurarchaeum sp.]
MEPAPLFVTGVPGGLELVVILLVVFLLFGVPATLIIVLGYRHVSNRARKADDERVAELEREVDELRDRIEEEME